MKKLLLLLPLFLMACSSMNMDDREFVGFNADVNVKCVKSCANVNQNIYASMWKDDEF
jgi:hypothetical protein